MTWREIATCKLATAQHLVAHRKADFDRPICRLAYDAAYALITAHLPGGMRFGRGRQNPDHTNVPAHVSHIAGLHELQRRAVRRAIRRLRQRREDADYRPGITVNQTSAHESMRDAHEVFRILNRSDGHGQITDHRDCE